MFNRVSAVARRRRTEGLGDRRAVTHGAQGVEQDVVVEFVLHADAQSSLVGAHDDAVGHELLDQFLGIRPSG